MEVMKMKANEWASYPGDLVMASTFDALRARAEAAEAKCAELEKEVNFNFSLMKKCDAELREKSEILERIDNLVMRGDAKCVVEEVRRVCSELGQAHFQLAAANERVAALEKERDGLRELLGEALSVLRGEWSILGMVACAEKIRSELNKQAIAKPIAEVGE